MAIRGKNLSATNKDGEKVNLAGSNSGNFGDSHAFTLVAADWYTAEVRSVKEAYIRMAVKDAESDESDGKFRHLRLQPDFRLHNENGTIISRQTFVVGQSMMKAISCSLTLTVMQFGVAFAVHANS
jgi:hypothetical protein